MYWTLKKTLGWLVRMIWVRNVEGLENLPESGAFIVAANHSSYFDFISLIAVLPRKVHFLAAEKFYKSALWRPFVSNMGQIRVDRNNSDKSEVYKKVFEVLENGEVLGIFPEGTRSRDGNIGKTFTGVAKFALGAKVPVVPIGIAGAFEVLSPNDKWPKFKKIIKIKIGKPMSFEEYYGKESDEFIMRQVTDKIFEKIENNKIESFSIENVKSKILGKIF